MSDSNSDSSQKSDQTDNRRVIGQGGISAENSAVSISSTNYSLDADVANNVVNAATSLAGKAFDNSAAGVKTQLGFALDVFNKGLSSSTNATNAALDSIASGTSLVKDAYADAKGRGAQTDTITMIALVMAGLVAFASVKRGRL